MNSKTIIKSVLSQNGYLPINRKMIKELGITEAALLAVLADGEQMFTPAGNDWFYCKADVIKQILNIGRKPYDAALKNLIEHDIVETKLAGVPPTVHFRLKCDNILKLLAVDDEIQFVQNGQINLPKTDKLNCSERTNLYNKENNNKESVKENIIKESPIIETYPFEQFWEAYDKKVGKPKAKALWDKLSDKDKEKITVYIPKYKQACPDKSFRKNPETFLRNHSWEDEIIERNNVGTTNQKGNEILNTNFDRINAAAEAFSSFFNS